MACACHRDVGFEVDGPRRLEIHEPNRAIKALGLAAIVVGGAAIPVGGVLLHWDPW